MAISRRQMLSLTGGAASAAVLESCLRSLSNPVTSQTLQPHARFGPLRPDPDGILDLPAEFRYRIISTAGQRMNDGHRVPGAFDGMGAFPGPDGHVILIRNHELLPNDWFGLSAPADFVYDAPCKGGTTTMVVAPDYTVVRQFTSLAGTAHNCAGGVTPWNSWISCEEFTVTPAAQNPWIKVTKPHGYNFEVPADASSTVAPEPLIAMGRFRHEAIAVDPRTNIIYQTEDQGDGLFYRFIPNDVTQLQAGGRLEALMVSDRPQTITASGFPVNQPVLVEWVPIEDVNPVRDTVRQEGFGKGAARFSRGEGICYSSGHIYFTCTNGGDIPHGQIWKYTPDASESPPPLGRSTGNGGVLELLAQPNNSRILDYPDNLVMSTWGDLLICEDGGGEQFIVGLTPEGTLYPFARNALNSAEFAGICPAPGSETLFLNIYSPGLTLAVWKA